MIEGGRDALERELIDLIFHPGLSPERELRRLHDSLTPRTRAEVVRGVYPGGALAAGSAPRQEESMESSEKR
ncbi:MAG: hypothetical protein DPW12_13065 [Rhodocyclaceae bacterium]|nr:hypothetical protein [Rhodocyclaceae bacterium]